MPSIEEVSIKNNVGEQAGNLLATKLKVPIMRLSLVRRARLTDKLIKGMTKYLTLVVAPAGYGKTTLLGEWLATTKGMNWQVAWVSLNSHDNDIARFWAYVVSALQQINPALQYSVHDLFSGDCNMVDCMQLNPLINEIAEIPHQFSLVLDDYHEIKNPQIHEALGYFINHLPENCHLILSSRILPPLPISRLRARGQLEEITSVDLSFTIDETEAFLTHVMNVGVQENQIISIQELTEGWIAGLQLAALSLQGKTESPSLFSSGNFDNRYILEFMTEEVLNCQDADTKDFLLKTSILDELSPPLCDALLGRNDSWEMLNYLEEANLFISPLDEPRYWYRYHQLFSELLIQQLQRVYPDEIASLHLAASRWFQQNNFPDKAVPHAIKAGETELAADIVEDYALQTIIQLSANDLIHWFDHLPQEIVQRRPSLLVYYTLANLIIGKVENLEEHLDKAEKYLENIEFEAVSAEEATRLRRYIDAVRVATMCTQGDYSSGIPSSQEVLDTLHPEDYFFLGLIEHYLAYAYQAAGRISDGIAAQSRACQNALFHGFHKEYVVSQSEKARFYRVQGKLRAAASTYQQIIDYCYQNSITSDTRLFSTVGLAGIYMEWDQLDKAEQLLGKIIANYPSSRNGMQEWFYAIYALMTISRFYIYQKKFEQAASFIHQAVQLSQVYYSIPNLYLDVMLAQVELWLAQGDIQTAINWASKRELQAMQQAQATPVSERLALAQVYLVSEDNKKANSLLGALVRELEDKEYGMYFLKALILKAVAQWKLGQQQPAVRTILQAVSLAEPERILRTFLDQGEPMRTLLVYVQNLPKKDLVKERELANFTFIDRLLTHFEDAAPKKMSKNKNGADKLSGEIILPLIEPLSDRELEVVALLAQGLSAGDVAKELVISVNTVKAHIKNIYQKLDVHTRKDAIERVVSLQLLV